ncbi:class I SAM-dependent methyltransferase [Mycobacterium sp. MYCO198283]|uniref:class I SAM-dependent methyltransferase n=1 Tax=Mycobacterium sp. MYCO198283 TaxID=2883505 RepID=UPI001E623C9A|nr:class I SAM-dependent methyltransferase [Mycobacterium sp. MYCO198283]MCG5432072.1 class I SAM-dependent methyltransferase [Mycobacterium sp. MYCO198283]
MRYEGDSWDITTSVGSTALFVAAARALHAQRPDPLAVDPFAEVFCRAVGGDWGALLDGNAPEHVLESEFGQFFRTYQGARTRYFDDYLLRAAAAGIRQVVILAAGLDSRAYRLDWPAGTRIFELDQPAVLQFKADALDGTPPRAKRRAVAVDLREDWPTVLRQHEFDGDVPTAWLAEGLLMYLPAAAQEQLFAGIDGLSAPGSHCAVEQAAPLPADVFAAAAAEEAADAQRRGTFFTLIYNEDVPAGPWFSERGWRAETTALPQYLQQLGEPVPAPDAEHGPMMQNMRLVSAVKR